MPRRLRPVFYGLPVPRFLFSLSGDCLLPGTAIRFFRGVGCEKHVVRSSDLLQRCNSDIFNVVKKWLFTTIRSCFSAQILGSSKLTASTTSLAPTRNTTASPFVTHRTSTTCRKPPKRWCGASMSPDRRASIFGRRNCTASMALGTSTSQAPQRISRPPAYRPTACSCWRTPMTTPPPTTGWKRVRSSPRSTLSRSTPPPR